MQTKLKQLDHSQVVFEVGLDKAELEGYMHEAEQIIGSKMSAKGFRRGKVPKNIIRDKVGEDALRQEALDLALRKSLQRALQGKDLDILKTIELKILKNDSETLSYEVKFQLFPEVALGEYRGIAVESRKQKVGEEEVNQTISYLQKTRAIFTDSDSPAGRGDRIEADFKITNGGKIIDGGESQNHPLVIGQGGFVPGFEESVIGMKKGEHKDFELDVPADYYQKDIAGKKISVSVDIKRVEHMKIPDFNDEFAKSLGNFSSAASLKENIIQGIKIEREEKEKERVRALILEKASDCSKMEIPDDLVKDQLDLMVEELDRSLQKQGLEIGLYLAQIKKTKDDLKKEWRPQAEKRVKSSLVLRAIGKKEGIAVTEDEVNKAVNGVLGGYRTVEEASKELNIVEMMNKMRGVLLNQKILDFLEKSAKINLSES